MHILNIDISVKAIKTMVIKPMSLIMSDIGEQTLNEFMQIYIAMKIRMLTKCFLILEGSGREKR